jgi:hypothetical protein
MPDSAFSQAMESRTADIMTSIITVLIFFLPILTSLLFNVPKRNSVD